MKKRFYALLIWISYNLTILRNFSNIAGLYLISFYAVRDYRCAVSASMHLSPFDFARNRYDYRLSARFSVHVVRGPRLVVSIRDSIVRGTGGSFYFVSAVIFDEGQIATRAFAGRARRLPRADHLKGEGNDGECVCRCAREDRENERWDKREASIWMATHTNVHLRGHCTASPRFLPRIPLFSHRVLSPFATRLLPRLLSKCSNCVLSEPSINILNYSLSLDAQRDEVTFSISSWRAKRELLT